MPEDKTTPDVSEIAFSADISVQNLPEPLAAAATGTRLTLEQAQKLAETASVHDLGRAGLEARRTRHGMNAYYVRNVHLNYTNVCINACRFCAFSKRPGDEGAYALNVEEAIKLVDTPAARGVDEVHIVGGLNPDYPFSFYEDLLKAAKDQFPDAAVKAFTAVEVAHLADTHSLSEEAVLERLMKAGLDMLPGGGAEVFSPALRARLCPEKVSGERWLGVHEKAHKLGLPTNATLLFGHIETWADRLDHMAAIRDLQDKTGGFKCFILLPYQPANNPLGGAGVDGVDYLRTMSLSRLFLDNVPHLKAYWVYAGIKAAQMALHAGADDMDGTLIEERIGHAAGANTPKGLTVSDLEHAITAAGFTPVRRSAQFETLDG
ncbi:aminofutalosine synthase MqnE [Desulfovibrio inopinatus]|uniref:aminofutalosine synthase MqnE n=1 Tax=Desulfovibrio inopinatus TaxID=102109 RepID=UPI000421D195|nr:aminofutalosine synthase MqnE [Desulfovibrio inopinatus]